MKLAFELKVFLFLIGWMGIIFIGTTYALHLEQKSAPIIELTCPDSDHLQTRIYELEDLYTGVHLDRIRVMNRLIIAEAELHSSQFKIHGRDFDDLNMVVTK